MGKNKIYLVERSFEDCVYFATWNGYVGGFYFFHPSDAEAPEKALLQKIKENNPITWETADNKDKKILGRLGYKLGKDLIESAPFENKPFYRTGRRKERDE